MDGYQEALMQLIRDFLAIFLVSGVGSEWEQVVKVFAMGMILVLMLGVLSLALRFMTNIIRPLIEALGQRPDYLLFAVIAALLLFFTSPVSFTGACVALLVFVSILLGFRIYQIQYAPQTLDQGPIWKLGAAANPGPYPPAGEDEDEDD